MTPAAATANLRDNAEVPHRPKGLREHTGERTWRELERSRDEAAPCRYSMMPVWATQRNSLKKKIQHWDITHVAENSRGMLDAGLGLQDNKKEGQQKSVTIATQTGASLGQPSGSSHCVDVLVPTKYLKPPLGRYLEPFCALPSNSP